MIENILEISVPKICMRLSSYIGSSKAENVSRRESFHMTVPTRKPFAIADLALARIKLRIEFNQSQMVLIGLITIARIVVWEIENDYNHCILY